MDIKKEYQDLETELQQAEQALNWEKAGQIKKAKEMYEKILSTEKDIEDYHKQLQDVQDILNKEKDEKLLVLAKQEQQELEEKKEKKESELKKLLNRLNGEEDSSQVIMEIRAGAGGDEASLFAADLFNMYSKYSQNQGWDVKILNTHQTELKGYKEISFSIKGENCFSSLKNEAGVHRVQRIPETEKQGRIHTSTATVAILKKAKESEIVIKPDDLQIDTYKSSGPGGQNVNKRETAIRITHLPTGIVVASQNERNQAQNKENALSLLRAKILEMQKQEQAEKIDSKRKDQVGQGKRSEKIRTYNYPQSRITDHRIKKTWHNLDQVMSGELEEIIDAL